MAHYTHRSAAALRFDCSMLAADETVFLLPRDHGRRFSANNRRHYGPVSQNFPHEFLGRHAAVDETVVLNFPERSAAEETIAKHIRSRLVRNRDYEAVDGGICVICQDNLGEGIAIARLDCGHNYHQNCIRKWLNLNNTCPLCKATVVVA